MSSVNNRFISSFPTYIPYSTFSYLIEVCRPSSMLLNGIGKQGCPYLAPDDSRKAYNLSPLIIMLVVCFLQTFFIKMREFSICSSLIVLSLKNVEFVKCFLYTYKYDHMIFLF